MFNNPHGPQLNQSVILPKRAMRDKRFTTRMTRNVAGFQKNRGAGQKCYKLTAKVQSTTQQKARE